MDWSELRMNEAKSFRSNVSGLWYYVLKWIAIITMLADHVAYMLSGSLTDKQYLIFRRIGRLSFPIFVFLLVESFYHTRNRKIHFVRLVVLAFLSEIPFDLFASGEAFYWNYQNVVVALAFYFLWLWITNEIQNKLPFEKVKCRGKKANKTKEVLKYGRLQIGKKILMNIIRIDSAAIFFMLCRICKVDYMGAGFVLLFLLDLAKRSKHPHILQLVALAVFVVCRNGGTNTYALFAVLPIWAAQICTQLSDGKAAKIKELAKRIFANKAAKLTCRFFYPVHLLVLWLISLAIS
jgi:hypothetical protein